VDLIARRRLARVSTLSASADDARRKRDPSVLQRALALPRHQDEEDAQTIFWRKHHKDRVAQGLAAAAAEVKRLSGDTNPQEEEQKREDANREPRPSRESGWFSFRTSGASC
jgi:hypothetical protein